MDWLVGKGATPSRYTGPDRDHTTGGLFGKIFEKMYRSMLSIVRI